MLQWHLLESKEQACPAEQTSEGGIFFTVGFICLFVFFLWSENVFLCPDVGFLPTHQLPGHLCPALPACVCPFVLRTHIFKNIRVSSLKYLLKWPTI